MSIKNSKFTALLILMLTGYFHSPAQEHSIARKWNDVLLESIRNDESRPTVHARNLFHISAAMYDCWTVYEGVGSTYFLGQTVAGFNIPFDGVPIPSNVQEAQEEAISYAAYRLLNHRFKESPGFWDESKVIMDSLFETLGYDENFLTEDYSTGNPAALGNYLAEQIISFGLQDGSFEQVNYGNQFYEPYNDEFQPNKPGSQGIKDPNRWQPMYFDNWFIDQSGVIFANITPEFTSPEWGAVSPFALTKDELAMKERDGHDYYIYHDPGPPALYDSLDPEASIEFVWNHSLVSKWSSHLDPTDGVKVDISPASIGNIMVHQYPKDFEEFKNFYNAKGGGDVGKGRPINPITEKPYEPQIVSKGDYTRVLAEFWADGPDSETPPGHWFSILHYVSDHPETIKKVGGEGRTMTDLEWDVKSYFVLGGAMHDAAICAWGVKGFYDSSRPISGIRYLADLGQSSDPNLSSYHPGGIKLEPGLIELVDENDSLAEDRPENIGKIKVFTWVGPDYIDDPETDLGGTGWILAENWWPYQRPSFVSPPFAGYVSGHSTFSRAAAEVMTLLTGSEYFPGGMGEFKAPKNEFLVFEEGPSEDIVLQWATYRDASDQCSLSRIWGGIHPPMDDIPGRLIGIEVGVDAFAFAEKYFDGLVLNVPDEVNNVLLPNPIMKDQEISLSTIYEDIFIHDLKGKVIANYSKVNKIVAPSKSGIYVIRLSNENNIFEKKIMVR